MTMTQLGEQYEASAAAIDARIRELTGANGHPVRDEAMIRRIAILRKTRDETAKTAQHLKKYYEKPHMQTAGNKEEAIWSSSSKHYRPWESN